MTSTRRSRFALVALLAAATIPACTHLSKRPRTAEVPPPSSLAADREASLAADLGSTTPPMDTKRVWERRSRRRPAALVVDHEIQLAAFTGGDLSPERQALTHLDLAVALESQGRDEDALHEYGRATSAFEEIRRLRGDAAERSRFHRKIARAYDRLGHSKEADEHFAEAKRLAPKDPKAWNDSGYSAYLHGRWGVAVEDLTQALRLDPADPRILNNLGLALAAAGDPKALEMLTKAGGPAAGLANLAYIEAASGRLEAATQHYRASLDARPDLETAKLALPALQRMLADVRDPETVRATR